MHSYLVVMDDTREAERALRYAARSAARTGGTVDILAVVEPLEVVEWSGVQAAMEEESRLRAEARVLAASGAIIEESGVRPSITVKHGTPVRAITDFLKERDDISALVLAAAAGSAPGPLVTHFASAGIAALTCPLVVVPAGLDDAGLERLTG
jgi:nucleotide-binding universal stress UspA family protein